MTSRYIFLSSQI